MSITTSHPVAVREAARERNEALWNEWHDRIAAGRLYRIRAEIVDGTVYDNRLILRFSFRDGRFAEVLEYYGEIAHGALMRRLGVAS
jgi:ketosteroid isomerase-like protein